MRKDERKNGRKLTHVEEHCCKRVKKYCFGQNQNYSECAAAVDEATVSLTSYTAMGIRTRVDLRLRFLVMTLQPTLSIVVAIWT